MEQEMLCGTVAAIVFQNQENGYTVLRLKSQDGDMVTVVGSVPMTVVGEKLSITGRWISHATYGRQFEADLLERMMPETQDEILSYLSSRAVKGIGEKTAVRIVTAFGDRSLEVIENEPETLAQVQGISLSKAREISENFRRQVGMRRLIEFLAAHHLPAELAMRLYRAYGELAVEALQDDPYMLTQSYFGADFAVVDAFEQKVLEAFKEGAILDWSELLASTQMSMGELAMIMMELELKEPLPSETARFCL